MSHYKGITYCYRFMQQTSFQLPGSSNRLRYGKGTAWCICHSSANCMVKNVTHREKHWPRVSLAFSEKLCLNNIFGISKGLTLCSAAVWYRYRCLNRHEVRETLLTHRQTDRQNEWVTNKTTVTAHAHAHWGLITESATCKSGRTSIFWTSGITSRSPIIVD